MTTARRDERGSLTVELVVLTPVLLIMALAMLAFGRVAEARQQVVEAARAGAEAASIAPDVASAEAASEDAATGGDGSLSRTCTEPMVTTDASQFHPGGYVTVTVLCRVPLADVAIPGMPGSTLVTASSTAPIDPYRSVG
jgi:Flp pilus assembly protein TadG